MAVTVMEKAKSSELCITYFNSHFCILPMPTISMGKMLGISLAFLLWYPRWSW